LTATARESETAYECDTYFFEADDLDAALDVGTRIPAARLGGAIEQRPVGPMLRRPHRLAA
jgi:hypothetical protein